MNECKARAEIITRGIVQGVGFRYFVIRNAENLGLTGFVENLDDGSVFTVAEGDKSQISRLYSLLSKGPAYAEVSECVITWLPYENGFISFDVKY
jgi:acylphosphatase